MCLFSHIVNNLTIRWIECVKHSIDYSSEYETRWQNKMLVCVFVVVLLLI